MKGWFYLFIASIGAGGFFALLVALARTPKLADLIPPQFFYHWLIGHVDLALIVGFLSFLMFLWNRHLSQKSGLLEKLLCYGGWTFIFFSSLFGLGKAVHNNYVPTIVHPLFFGGIFLFGIGYLLTALRFLKESLKGLTSADPVKVALSVSVLLSVLFPLTLIVSFLRQEPSEEIYLYYERLYWLGGHIHQFVNASLLVTSWLLISRYDGRDAPYVLRYASLYLIPFPLVYFFLQVVVSDPISAQVKMVTTLGYAVGIGIPTLATAFYLLFKHSFRGSFLSNALGLSVLMYILGAGMGYLIAGSDLRIPAHYHGVIASILIALMTLTYVYLKEMKMLEDIPPLARLQPYLYGVGMLLFTSGLFWAGVYGAPRKTYGTGYIESLKVYLFMALMGLGSVLSVLGGIIFVALILYALFRSRWSWASS